MCEFCEKIKEDLETRRTRYNIQSVTHINRDRGIFHIVLKTSQDDPVTWSVRGIFVLDRFLKDLEDLNYQVICYQRLFRNLFIATIKFGTEE